MRRTIKTITYNPSFESKQAHGFSNVRWVDNVSLGLRLVGYADKLLHLNHNGWFTHDDGDPGETYRGVVYQLPARDHTELYVYGYADPCNDDCAVLSFDPVADKSEAARYADNLAERFAESERDYNRAWDAGTRYKNLNDEIRAMRKQALTIGAEMRAARKSSAQAPAICALAHDEVLSLYRHIQKARAERDELLDNYSRVAGFNDAREE